MKRCLVLGTVVLTTALATASFERDAWACGGCFAPSENPTVVSDHRMILSISKDQSTLYDQIRYSGSPSSFAWVLPIAGTVDVGLSADILFDVIDGQTQTRLIAPPRNCPPPPSDCYAFGGAAADGGAAPTAPGSVNVIKHEVVGPYDTVQLQSSDPAALDNWLKQNGYSIPADIEPVIAEYVNEKFDFLALKLVPGAGVSDMRPVRVTTKGASAVLPLRMVAAGTGPTVGISLWIVGEGRYEPQNFPWFYVQTSELAWDWTQSKSNYTELRAQKTAAGGGRAWEIESSIALYRTNVESLVRNGSYYTGTGPYPTTDEERAEQDYLPVKDAQGNVTETAAQVRDADLATLFYGIATSPRVTRMRADLAHAALAADMAMIASSDQGELSNVRQITNELNQPLCPVYDGCQSTGQAPRDQAAAHASGQADGDMGGGGCATTRPGAPPWMTAAFGFCGLAAVNALRRRRKRD